MTTHSDRVWDMMESIDYCMLVVCHEDGLASRPMSSIPRRSEDRVYFLSNADAEQLHMLIRRPQVLLAYGDGTKTFVSIQAQATVSRDRGLIKRLWNAGAQAFWPDGPESADVAVITAVPEKAEFWDGSNGLVAGVKMAFALATGTTPDLGDNAKVRL